jgi:hypothetical protein
MLILVMGDTTSIDSIRYRLLFRKSSRYRLPKRLLRWRLYFRIFRHYKLFPAFFIIYSVDEVRNINQGSG